jgi:hypothetical protein
MTALSFPGKIRYSSTTGTSTSTHRKIPEYYGTTGSTSTGVHYPIQERLKIDPDIFLFAIGISKTYSEQQNDFCTSTISSGVLYLFVEEVLVQCT